MNKTTHDKIMPGQFPHVPRNMIEEVNKLIHDHGLLEQQVTVLRTSVHAKKSKKDDRWWKITVVGTIVTCLTSLFIFESIQAVAWTFLLTPFLLAFFAPKEDPSERTRLNSLEARLKNLAEKILMEKRKISATEIGISENIFKKNAEYWLEMTGWQFEKEVAKLFELKGYQVTITKGSADGGVDLLLKKEGVKYAVQCKNHRKPIGPSSVRDLYGAMRHEKTRKGIFISSSGYTRGASEFAEGKPIEMLDISDVIKMHSLAR